MAGRTPPPDRSADDEIPYAAGLYEGPEGARKQPWTAGAPDGSTIPVNPTDDPGTLRLHPSLARIAVRYQRVRLLRIQGQLTDIQAAEQLGELVARDDHGIMWMINPADGGWLYMSRDGSWRPGVPPESGLATANAFSLDRAAGGDVRLDNPDLAITWTEPEVSTDPWEEQVRGPQPRRELNRPRWVYPALVTVAVVVAAWFLFVRDSGTSDEAPPASTPAADVRLPG